MQEIHFYKETTNENNQFSKTKTWISNSYFIKQSLKGYCCELYLPLYNNGVLHKMIYKVS